MLGHVMHVCICVCICMYVCMCIYVCMFVYICVYVYIYVCMYVCVYVCMYAHSSLLHFSTLLARHALVCSWLLLASMIRLKMTLKMMSS